MRYSYENSKGEQSINSMAVFVDCLNNRDPLTLTSFDEFFEDCAKLIETEFKPTQGALNNVRGNWYEWLISIGYSKFLERNQNSKAPNTEIDHDYTIKIVQLPNVSGFDLYELYTSEVYRLIEDLRNKTKNSGATLISSNPDFVIIREKNLQKDRNITTGISEKTLLTLEKSYEKFKGECHFGDIAGFLSVKTSLRPDRRLQLSHEGALTKAFHEHLKTRLWVRNAKPLLYFACAMNATEPDQRAMQSVATHSILSVNSDPEPAVNSLEKVSSGAELDRLFKIILGKC